MTRFMYCTYAATNLNPYELLFCSVSATLAICFIQNERTMSNWILHLLHTNHKFQLFRNTVVVRGFINTYCTHRNMRHLNFYSSNQVRSAIHVNNVIQILKKLLAYTFLKNSTCTFVTWLDMHSSENNSDPSDFRPKINALTATLFH